jgi:FtsP/CotA-like multicopper oxidase with cupredoxin domain
MRILIGLATAAALVLLFVLARPGDNGEATKTATQPKVTTSVSRPTTTAPSAVSPVWRIDAREQTIARRSVDQGAQVAIFVTANTNDEVHVHGYDLKKNVAPGKSASIRFRADVPGRFEIELENAGKQIAELTVNP